MKPVTDPSLLQQLEARQPVTDDALLRQLEDVSPTPAPQDPDDVAATPSAAGRATFLPYSISEKDEGHEAGLRAMADEESVMAYFEKRGIEPAVPGIIMAPIEAMGRLISGEYTPGEGGARQRALDALTIASSGVTGALPRSVGTAAKAATPAGGVTKQEAVAAGKRIGVDVPRAVASDGYIAPAVGAGLRDLPAIGQPLVKATGEAGAKMQETVAGVADDLGAGNTLAAGIAMKDDITGWITTGSKSEAAEIYRPVEAMVGKTKAPISRTGVALRELAKEADEMGLKAPAIVKELEAAVNKKGGLTFEAMQGLRTQIGDRLSGAIVPEPGLSKTALKRIYGSLSDDLDFLVGRAAGEKGKVAWAQANDAFKKQISQRRDNLAKIVGLEGNQAPEAVAGALISMAGSKGGANINRLRLAKESASEASWNELGSAVVNRLGETKDGFSLKQFRSEWQKLSDDGKALLFSPEHRQALDDVFTVGAKFENFDKLGNKSRSGVLAGLMSVGVAAYVDPWALAASTFGQHMLARILAKPATAKATANWAKAYAEYGAKPNEENFNIVKRAGLEMRRQMEINSIPADAPIRALAVGATTQGQQQSAPSAPTTNEAPPMPGARKAPDGNWYLPDPIRPGKYLKIIEEVI